MDQPFRCQDCGNFFEEDEVDILRRSPVDRGYLACFECIASYREKMRQERAKDVEEIFEEALPLPLRQEITLSKKKNTVKAAKKKKQEDQKVEVPTVGRAELVVRYWWEAFVYILTGK